MQVIATLNQKGGAGKTTIATQLARGFQLDGERVVLVDSDPQGSARDWAAVSEDNPVMTVGIDRPTLDRDVRKLPADVVVIDGAPHLESMAVSAIKAADLVLIPVQPSPYDVWATAALVDLVKQRIELTDGKLKAVFVVSRAITGTSIANEIFDTLAGYELPVLKTAIHQRVDYPKTAARGGTVLDLRTGDLAAANEVKQLVAEIRTVLDGTHLEA
jgi:chromosome partitioning protein